MLEPLSKIEEKKLDNLLNKKGSFIHHSCSILLFDQFVVKRAEETLYDKVLKFNTYLNAKHRYTASNYTAPVKIKCTSIDSSTADIDDLT